jgi:hypothetical protein
MAGVFQVQAKDSVVKLNAFDAINAVQNVNLDPTFNEEYYSELGNTNYADQSRRPETSGSFDVTATCALPAMLARMVYNYTTQTYKFDPTTKGNVHTITETDFENAVFDFINLKQPGLTFSDATLVPNAQLTGLTINVDANGTASETYSFAADLQESFYKPYHDMVSVPLTTASTTTATVPAAYSINSGTHHIMYVFKDNVKYDYDAASFSAVTTVSVPTAAFTNAAPYERVMGVFYKRTPGAFPTIYYPTSARFVRGDRIDIWLVNSGVLDGALSDTNRLLRCQSASINVDLTRDALSEIRRNNDKSTIYWRALNYPLTITANVNLTETTLQQWATLQGKTLNEAATGGTVDTNNILNLADFSKLRLIVKQYKYGSDTPLVTVTMNNIDITGFGEAQQVGGRAERTLSFTGSAITIAGING